MAGAGTSNTDFILRQASPEEAIYVHELAHRIWKEHYVPIIGTDQVDYMLGKFYTVNALQNQMANGHVFWLIEMDGNPHGYISVTNQEQGKYFLQKFYLDNGFRGKGLGKQVLNSLIDQYPDLQELRLTVNRQNYKSINFYFKVGFTIEYCLDMDIGEGYEMNDFQMLLKRFL